MLPMKHLHNRHPDVGLSSIIVVLIILCRKDLTTGAMGVV
jgi:hypothetical protein